MGEESSEVYSSVPSGRARGDEGIPTRNGSRLLRLSDKAPPLLLCGKALAYRRFLATTSQTTVGARQTQSLRLLRLLAWGLVCGVDECDVLRLDQKLMM